MVLNNSSDTTANESLYNSDNTPPSDGDTYDESNIPSGSLKYRIDGSVLPRPIPIIGRFLIYTPDNLLKVLDLKYKHSATVLHRLPTEEEAQALAYWTAKQMSILSYAGPVGLLAGAYGAYSTAETMKFPFYQPDLEKLFAQRYPPVRGTRAFWIWHGLRASAYGTVGYGLSTLFYGSYAMSVTAVGEASDPRLKDYVKAIRDDALKRQGNLQGAQARGPQNQTQRGPGSRPGDQRAVDDASPTGGAYGDDFVSETEAVAEAFQKPQETFQSSVPNSSRFSKPTPPSVQQQDKPFDPFGDDDASPTGGQGMMGNTTPSKAQVSAWDRIRQSASVNKTTAKATGWTQVQQTDSSKQDPNNGDAFAFSEIEEESSLSRDEAQKDFDARVEKERRGGEFGSENPGMGDQRRW